MDSRDGEILGLYQTIGRDTSPFTDAPLSSKFIGQLPHVSECSLNICSARGEGPDDWDKKEQK